MMEHRPLDPYEQQLLKVFDSYDLDNCGSLDREGLTQLCRTLQLEEHGTELIKCLLKDPKSSRATFMEFKEALLALLGSIQNGRNGEENPTREIDKGSPDREVSPKFVYGSKKYGRRSRPRCDEISTALKEENDTNCFDKNVHGIPVQRSNSQSDVSYSKKRKTNYKLKRCTSLPGSEDFEFQKSLHNGFSTPADTEFVCTEGMLREAWNKLGVGKDGYLNQTEILLVCDAIGLHNLAKGVIRQLKDKLEVDFDHRISFKELLETLQQDETWTEVFGASTPNTNDDSMKTNMSRITEDSLFPDSQIFQYVTLGPDGNGSISTDLVIEMWENAGITSPKHLLSDLGFNSQRINVVDLANVLEREIKGIADVDRSEFTNPHVALLQANLTLYQSEIRCLQNILEQMNAEREKLKCDVFEANNRATLLAQEVDDNHAKMERSSQNQVKLLEQRHAEILKQMSEQFANDKEQVALLNNSLEQKILCLENEEIKLKSDLIQAQKYSCSLEKENQLLNEQISELNQAKNALSEQIGILESEKQKYMEIEQIEPLLAKLSTLQLENSQLRDRTDEMVSEIESLSGQLNSMRAKMSSTPTFNTLEQSVEENISIICEGVVGLGSKRRSDESPSKDINTLGLGDGSPRLGKVRKYHKNRDMLEVPFTSSESGFDTEIDYCDSSSFSVSGNESEEISRLQSKIQLLEKILKQNSIPIPSCGDPELNSASEYERLKLLCRNLERTLLDVKYNVSTMLTNGNEIRYDALQCISEKLNGLVFEETETGVDNVDVCIETEANELNLRELVKKYEVENLELTSKCEELENCVELLRNEYEKCEDYWATKLDEERQMYEQEQNQNTEKLNELISKISEYEEQFAIQEAIEKRLPPIEENNLEKQFTDLEQEFEDYKEQTELKMLEKNNEIDLLKQRLTELAKQRRTCSDTGVQVNISSYDLDTKLSNLSNHVVESTNLFSADAMPFGCNNSEPTLIGDNEKQRDYVNPAFIWNKPRSSQQNSLPVNMAWQDSPQHKNQPSMNNCSTPCRPKRTRRHAVLTQRMHKMCPNKDESASNKSLDASFASCKSFNDEPTCVVPVSTMHSLNGRLHHLEMRCRHLQMSLKQQHYYAEQTLHSYWQQHRGEKAELQYLLKNSHEKLEQQIKTCNEQLERLARTDMLVKDLYVENSYLIANVQRLEQRCHMLAQCSSSSSM